MQLIKHEDENRSMTFFFFSLTKWRNSVNVHIWKIDKQMIEQEEEPCAIFDYEQLERQKRNIFWWCSTEKLTDTRESTHACASGKPISVIIIDEKWIWRERGELVVGFIRFKSDKNQRRSNEEERCQRSGEKKIFSIIISIVAWCWIKSTTNVCFPSTIYLFNQTSLMIILIPNKEFSSLSLSLCLHSHSVIDIDWKKRTFAIIAAQSSQCLVGLCGRQNEEIVCKGWLERKEEKNEEEVIKTSLIYRTCDYVQQSVDVIDWPSCCRFFYIWEKQ